MPLEACQPGASGRAVRLDRFMAEANAAYYAVHDPFADFTTSPEIAQCFGEILGAWAAVVWQQMGMPDPLALVEAGPGRGTLMQDALRCVRRVAPAFFRAVRVHLIETSPRLRLEQASRVADAAWHEDLAGLPPWPCIVLANEFLDALPVRQFVCRPDGWAERHVRDGAFVEVPAENPGRNAPVGGVVEVSEAQQCWIEQLTRRLLEFGGAALILDYGSAESLPGDSLQALRGGKPCDPLTEPGSADLTAHVDFACLARAARTAGAAVWGPVTQGVFLGRLGLWTRTAALEAANPAQAGALRAAALRLASPDRMGELFKVMCVSHPGSPCPPGFEA